MKYNTCKQCKYYKDGYCKERGIGSTAWEWACALFKRKRAGECESHYHYYDPEEDERSGCVDDHTGWWYVDYD